MSHVFVVRGDLMRLSCDAWLVPGGRGPGKTWQAALPPRADRLPLPPGFGDDAGPRTTLLAALPPPEPLPFLTNIASTEQPLSWFVDGARAFVRAAAAAVMTRAPHHGRHKHLLALPLVGTGGGGAAPVSGELLRLLLVALDEEAAAADVDVALVLNDGLAFAAAQVERLRGGGTWARSLSPLQLAEAARLASLAQSGDLVLFLGAGLSQAAGLPSWDGLLSELATERAGLKPDEAAAFGGLGELDRAALISRRLPPGQPLGQAIAALLLQKGTRYGLGHGLLSCLPVDEVITTNYDALFEVASASIGRPCVVLPGGQAARGQRWLLKMHGCVTRPDTIVVTREDYLKFQENRSALGGIVQALLLTRHMLFVGFSFSDDNFHRIAHAVRQALGGRKHFGTNLVVRGNPLARELWADDAAWIVFDADEDRSLAAQARRVEIFLDRVAAGAATVTTHLGDHRYDGVLSEAEQALRRRLELLLAATPAPERGTPAWAEVERLFSRLGIGREPDVAPASDDGEGEEAPVGGSVRRDS